MLVRLIVPQNTLAELEVSQRDELAALAAFTGAEIFTPKTSPMESSGGVTLPRILEIGSEKESYRWATSIQDALAPTPFWGGNVILSCNQNNTNLQYSHVSKWGKKTWQDQLDTMKER
jgi:hypothetical protein